MKCKACGAEIADKALICYRCGASTFEMPPPASGARERRRPLLPPVLALIVLVVAALLMPRAAIGETPRYVGYVLLALAAIVVAWRLARRG
ncbi:MAG: zinc ribbon domain-containing protein [Vicinamibacterales bacterium]